ncbi:hypothetical protein MLD38_040223 [Melastoma candidum]|uniref:Uncharacterized protein n=1 Tax=Melastoma candidum TaxID=119954 RepID=A0ACB9L4J3_9MYRT|nr:hypothetical protein MLD38_040223 [Melastoma candidum]
MLDGSPFRSGDVGGDIVCACKLQGTYRCMQRLLFGSFFSPGDLLPREFTLTLSHKLVQLLLYLQPLFRQVDTLSAERVLQIFRQKKLKKIGIRSKDLSDALERCTKGSGIALLIVIPAAIFGLWVFSDWFLANDTFHFELVPAMMGMFVYKAAALVQVYRDNEDLRFIFPESEEASSDGQR